MVYLHPWELSSQNFFEMIRLDDRYLNLIERWFMGFRTKKFKKNFFSLLARYGGCSIRDFLRFC